LLSRWFAFRSCVILVIGCLILPGLGVPQVAQVAEKTPRRTETRFPCEDCRCGCRSADHCWSCCSCHTLAERLAWAERNGVEPPDFVKVYIGASAVDSGARPSDADGPSNRCCAHQSKNAPILRDRCRKGLLASASAGGQGVILIKALLCRGVHIQWSFGGTLVLRPDASFTDQDDRISYRTRDPVINYSSPHLALDSPPPRASRVLTQPTAVG
jgi:hypothetical protein